ncbi:PH domain-containing protein [Actinomadura atramentaria]|uniref:PH domain-containing protein n=1 Tax=Actinomadura atramentaria TaxID=1990 RepID=UPI0003788EC9|nr:PH domain-containing protein [Actinomadura atramentaria]
MTPQLAVRSAAGRIIGWAFVAFTVLNLFDLAVGITGEARLDRTGAIYALVLLTGCGVAYALGLRPAILADEAGVTVRNPLRDTRAPWRSVREITGGTAVTVRFAGPGGGETATRAWVQQTSPRAQAKVERRARRDEARGTAKIAAARLRGRTAATFTAQQLNEIADRARPRARSGAPDRAAGQTARAADAPTTGTVTWSWLTAASIAVPLLVLIIVLAL